MPNLSLQFFNPTILPQLLWSPRNQVRNLRKQVSFTLPNVCIERIMMKPRYIVAALGPRIQNLSHFARNHSWQAPHQTDTLNQPHITSVQCFFALVAHPASTCLFWFCTAWLAKHLLLVTKHVAIERQKVGD